MDLYAHYPDYLHALGLQKYWAPVGPHTIVRTSCQSAMVEVRQASQAALLLLRKVQILP